MTRARLRRGIRKRREAREARERKARRVWAASLPPPLLETSEGPEPCRHSWGEPEAVSFSCGSRDEIRVCAKCQGFVHRLRDAVGTTWSMRDGAASTQCPRGSPSRG